MYNSYDVMHSPAVSKDNQKNVKLQLIDQRNVT